LQRGCPWQVLGLPRYMQSDWVLNPDPAIFFRLQKIVFVNETQVDTDLERIIEIVCQCGYRGYLPLETLGEGDPYQKVEVLYNKVKAQLSI
jgi:hypothetical protein